VVVGRRRWGIRDAYHFLLGAPWWLDVSLITAAFLAANLIFACAYLVLGGVANARPGSFGDAFFFSVQTMGTIGYGEMYPVSLPANLLVTSEAVFGLVLTALATGLVFAKFSAVRPRLVFARRAVITPLNGVSTLMVRVGNERGNYIAEVEVHLILMRTEQTLEGRTLYRMRDLVPVRSRSPAFSRGMTIMHTIDESSPLKGDTAQSLRTSEAELIVTLVGLDGTTGQYVHARCSYLDDEILFDHHLADMLTILPDGRMHLDLRQFDGVEPDGG
jgi:inward rectifier potassium channel